MARITKKVQSIINDLNEEPTKSEESKKHIPTNLIPNDGIEVKTPSSADDFKWLLRWNGYNTQDGKTFVKVLRSKTEAVSVQFIDDTNIKRALVNKITNDRSVTKHDIDEAFKLLLYK